MVASNYSFGIERDEKQLKANDGDWRTWSNPLESRLVFVYCIRMSDTNDITFRKATECPEHEILLCLRPRERDRGGQAIRSVIDI
jgi:hypothetical protein